MARTIDRTVEATTTPPRGVAPIRKVKRGGPAIVQFYRSAVGKKWVMAVTGIVLMGFVLGHMIGNLKLFLSKEELNLYGEALRDVPGHLLPRTVLLWTVRIGLVAAFVFHIHAAATLTIMNRKARPETYKSQRDYVAADFASRTMRWTGIIIALFLIFHLMDLTWGNANPDCAARRPVQQPHLQHATRAGGDHLHRRQRRARRSTCTTAPGRSSRASGINNPKYNAARRRFAQGFAAVILVGNLTLPDRGAARPGRRRVPADGSGRRNARRSPALTLDSRSPEGRSKRSGTTTSSRSSSSTRPTSAGSTSSSSATGLAGASAAATLGELGYNVKVITFHDSPRRAHSIAAQGGINAAKNYKNDGDSIYRLFYDTIKGGDYRAREANVYRLAQVSVEHHRPVRRAGCAVRTGVRRTARQPVVRWRAGVAHVLRAWSDRSATPARCVPGADATGARGHRARCTRAPRCSTSSSRTARPPASSCRDLNTGEVYSLSGHAVVLATGGYGNAFYLSTNAKNSNVTAAWRASKRGAYMANPCFTQIHPTCIPASDDFQSKLTLMSESLRNDGRVWVPKQTRRPSLARPDPGRRPRLLPRAPLPRVRQPRAARRRVARDQA